MRLRTSLHPSLVAAKDRARRDERDRIRRARISCHLALGTVAMLTLIVVGTLMANLVAFWAAVVLLYVGLGSLAEAYWIWVNGAWGSTRERGALEPVTLSDRVILAMVERSHHRSVAAMRAEPAPAILLVPPA